jgi:hypothetical protein
MAGEGATRGQVALASLKAKKDLMMGFLTRSLYRCLLRLHPLSFRSQFAREMLRIFDEEQEKEGVIGTTKLLADAFVSLARQWLVRRFWEKLTDSPISDNPCHKVHYTSAPIWKPWRDYDLR